MIFQSKQLLIVAGVVIALFGASASGAQSSGVPVGELLPLTHKTKAAQNAESSPFKVRALLVPVGEISPISDVRPLIKQASLRGYNTVILLMARQSGGANKQLIIQVPEPGKAVLKRFTQQQMRSLIAFCRSVGMEPVVSFHVIGKQHGMLGKLDKRYPDLLISTTAGLGTRRGVLNTAFRFPDGSDPFEACVKPIIDMVMSWYGNQPPQYMMLAQDEMPVKDLAAVGRRSGRTAAQVFADAMNRYASYLLKQGVTPVFYSDMLLSHRLAKPGNGVKGFTFDPRFALIHDGTYNAERGASGSGISVLTAVNYLKYKDKIVIANWHYQPHIHGQYPSVDYFQAVGIGHIWGVTFHQKRAIRQYTRYAANHSVEGMVAATFYLAWKRFPRFRVQLPSLVNNSILYFLDPEFQRPKPAFLSYRVSTKDGQVLARGDWGVVLSTSANTAIVHAQVPESVQAQRVQFWLVDENGRERLVGQSMPAKDGYVACRINLQKRQTDESSLFRLWLRYRDAKTGYLAQKMHKGVVALADQPPPVAGQRSDNALFQVDFSSLTDTASDARILIAPGKYGGLMLLRGSAKGEWSPFASGGALQAQSVDAYAWLQDGLWETIAHHGMHLIVEAKLTKPVQKKPKPWASLVSFGDYHKGFRMLVNADGTVHMQVGQARPTVPSWPGQIKSSGPMQIGEWTHIEVWLTPPDAAGNRRLTMRVDNNKPKTVALHYPVVAPVGRAIGVGVEFFRSSTTRKRRPNFPGLIRSVEILPFTGLLNK